MGTTLLGSVEAQLEMPYILCPEERKYFARLLSLVVLIKDASSLFDEVDVYAFKSRLQGLSMLSKKLRTKGTRLRFWA